MSHRVLRCPTDPLHPDGVLYVPYCRFFADFGLQGATETMLKRLGGQLFYPNTAALEEKRDETNFNKIFTELVARQLLADLKKGLTTNDLNSIDISKLTNEDNK